MSKFSDFFKRIQPFSGDFDVLPESPGRPSPSRSLSPPSLARVDITDPIRIHKSSPRSQHEKRDKILDPLLSPPVVDLEKIREISWMGFPPSQRARIWRLFLDYEPLGRDQADAALLHKRNDYFDCMSRLFNEKQMLLWTTAQKQTKRQIEIDLPRTSLKLLRNERVINLFQHVLFVWAVRHPASGYVQGMNDILQPFFFVFIQNFFPEMKPEQIAEKENIDEITDEKLNDVEADCFWCFSRLLDGIQDVYTKDQPGLNRMIENLQYVVKKGAPSLAKIIEEQNIPYTNFTIRWMGCLLVREFPLSLLFRIWDLFVSSSAKIASTQVYICAGMLANLSAALMDSSTTEFIVKIQSLSKDFWDQEKLESVLALSFVFEKNFPLPSGSNSI